MQKSVSFLKTKAKLIAIGIITILIIFFGFTFLGSKEQDIKNFVVERRNISEEVSVSGQVEAATDVDLSFERSGQINSIYPEVGEYVAKGDVIMTLGNSSESARLAQAKADLQIEQIKLEELLGNSVSNITTSENDLRLAEINLENSRENLKEKILETFLEINNAVKNYSDRLFDGSSNSPTFGIFITSGSKKYAVNISDQEKKRGINNKRRRIYKIFQQWGKLDLENNTSQKAEQILEDLLYIQTFMSDLVNITNKLTEPDDLTFRTTFNNLKDGVSTAQTTVNSALTDLRTSLQTYKTEEIDFNFVSSQTSSTGEDARLQEARVVSAKARVAAELATLNQGIIHSPVDGRVTSIKTEISEVVSVNTPVVTVVSDALYEIVINIPEADVSRVQVGNESKITLDAYTDNEFFYAKVTSIDLSETIVDGVTTYEARLQFNKKDERIRSGMTANVLISGKSRKNVLAVPQKAIVNKEGLKIVRIIENEEIKDIPVETGIRGTDGYVEIISGLKEGQRIITSTK